MPSLITRLRRRVRAYRIKREVKGPREFTARMEDIQAKLQNYRPPVGAPSYENQMLVQYHTE